VYAGPLTDESGVMRWVAVTLGVSPAWWRVGDPSDTVDLFVFTIDRETWLGRGSVRMTAAVMPLTFVRRGEYRIFGGRVAADDLSALEFEYEEGETRYIVRVRPRVGVEVKEKRS
jgi:hypothetical protein